MSSWMMHRHPEAFPDPDKFDPTRWMDPEMARARDRYLVPFSRGQFMCIGYHLAQCELLIVLATMFRRFESMKTDFKTDNLRVLVDRFVAGVADGCPLFEVSVEV